MDFLSSDSVPKLEPAPKAANVERNQATVPRGVCPRILLDQIRNTAPFVLEPYHSEENGAFSRPSCAFKRSCDGWLCR